MRVLLLCALVALVSLSPVSAFTNGTLLPGYLCGVTTGAGVAADGLPKSLGGVLPLLELPTFDGLGNGTFSITLQGEAHRVDRPLDADAGGSLLNTQLLLGGFHNGQNGITAFQNGIIVNISSAQSTTGGVTLPGGVIYPGYDHIIQLLTRNPTTNAGVFDNAVPIIGAIVYAQLNSNGNRIGEFVQTGENMQLWPPCGPGRVGVVHNAELSETGTYTGLVWRAPWNLAVGTVINFRGAAVTDLGFGPHWSQFTVQNPPTVVPPPAPLITSLFTAGRFLNVFFADASRGSTWAPATVFSVNLVDTTRNNAATSINGTASPVTLDYVAALTGLGAQAGDSISVTVTAFDAAGLSTRSAAQTWTATLTPRTPTFADLLGLCDPTRQAQRTQVGADADPDGGCLYQQNFVTQSIQASLNLTATCPYAANPAGGNGGNSGGIGSSGAANNISSTGAAGNQTRLNSASQSGSLSGLTLVVAMAFSMMFLFF